MTGIALAMAEDWIASKRQELKDLEADVIFMRREIIDAERGEGSIVTHIRQWAEDARPRHTTRRAPWRLPTAPAYRHDICDKCQGSGVHSHTDSGDFCHKCKGSGAVPYICGYCQDSGVELINAGNGNINEEPCSMCQPFKDSES